ncbi:hypothetical protein DFR50_108191 [Roseiarcus fermentans]|uniref:Uncharacterized protein n=1 Tax=Roseiarcus fermentans TaxID=1473586 RepID=A0A366FLQ6_9HYPH|nr:hypothetical protein [Roseiarcus fermentans]RBP15633.1 hypothetical protein DFR50_108191 [Roseiarcus fermentans]
MRSEHCGYRLRLSRIRHSIEFQKNDAEHRTSLANDLFAKVTILRNENSVLRDGKREKIAVGSARTRCRNRNDVMTSGADPFDDETGYIFVRQEASHWAASTVSC